MAGHRVVLVCLKKIEGDELANLPRSMRARREPGTYYMPSSFSSVCARGGLELPYPPNEVLVVPWTLAVCPSWAVTERHLQQPLSAAVLCALSVRRESSNKNNKGYIQLPRCMYGI